MVGSQGPWMFYVENATGQFHHEPVAAPLPKLERETSSFTPQTPLFGDALYSCFSDRLAETFSQVLHIVCFWCFLYQPDLVIAFRRFRDVIHVWILIELKRRMHSDALLFNTIITLHLSITHINAQRFPMASMVPNTSPGYGRTFLIGGVIVASGLTGFYLNMLRMKRKQQEAGQNPHFEQIIAAVSKPVRPGEEVNYVMDKPSINPPRFRDSAHHSAHNTLANYKSSPEYAESGDDIRHMVPTPQRQHTDGSGRAYTKSPDYVQNYGKTVRPGHAPTH